MIRKLVAGRDGNDERGFDLLVLIFVLQLYPHPHNCSYSHRFGDSRPHTPTSLLASGLGSPNSQI